MKRRVVREGLDNNNVKEYKGYTYEYFPWTLVGNGKEYDMNGYIIHSPYYLKGNGEEKYYLPLRCQIESGETIDFKTEEQVKDYIDNYLVPEKVDIKIIHGDEVTAVIKDEFKKELEEDVSFGKNGKKLVRDWWDKVIAWNEENGYPFSIDNGSVFDYENDEDYYEGMLGAMFDMLIDLKSENKKLYDEGKKIYNKYSLYSKIF